jgi:hypothetical protein
MMMIKGEEGKQGKGKIRERREERGRK